MTTAQFKFGIAFIAIVLSVHSLWGQSITYNHLVDSADKDTQLVIELFENYIHSNPTGRAHNLYWNEEDQENFVFYDFLESEFQPSLYMGFPIHVLSIKNADGVYQIKAQFSNCSDGELYVLAVVNYYAKKEGDDFKLFNALQFRRERWQHTSLDLIDFYYPPYHQFDQLKAQRLLMFVKEICQKTAVEPTPFEYYFADEYDEVLALKGVDYALGMGGETKPSGRAIDNKVYCGGQGEEYRHEVFHIQIDRHFPNKHFWVSEGVATMLGGSRGEDLSWHIKRTNNYLKEHPEINLNNLLMLSNMNQHSAYHYVLGGLIAKNILDQKGWEGIIEFMESGPSDGDYYTAIEDLLGVPRESLNHYLREELERQSRLN